MVKSKFTRIISLALAALFLVSGATIAVSADATVSNVTDKSIEDYIDKLNTVSYDEYRLANQTYFDNEVVKDGSDHGISFDATKGWQYWAGGVDKYGRGKGNGVTLNASSAWTLTDTDGKTYTQKQAENAGMEMSSLAYIDTFDGVKALYTPNSGSVTWTLDLTSKGIRKAGLYSITIVYYPVEGKSAAIEREFYINYAAPFSEARALTFAKNWEAVLRSGETSSELTAIYKPNVKANKLAETLAAVKSEADALGITATINAASTALLIERPNLFSSDIVAFLDKYDIRFFETDDSNNELRPTTQQAPEWMTYSLRDSDGYYSEDFGFVIEPDANGKITLTLSGVNESMAISEIVLTPYAVTKDYEAYIADLKGELGNTLPEGTDVVRLEAEYTINTSTNVVYPIEDRASALTSPCDTTRTLLNTIGTEKWETAGQWVEYRFTVNSSGMYDIYSRYKQSYLDGMYVSRSLQIFTNYEDKEAYEAAHGGKSAGYYNGIPFSEAGQLRYEYKNTWQVTHLTNDNENFFNIYFEAGVEYTLRFEVTLGSMSDNIREIESILKALNQDYLDIIKLTGSSPDDYRDYSFSSLLPETLIDMIRQARALEALSNELKKNTASTYTGICDKLSNLLDDMGHDEDQIAKNLDNFKSYVGSLGTMLTDSKTQPLQLDYLLIQGASEKAPKAVPNFFQSLFHEISSFIQSFFRDYNNMGARADASDTVTESVDVWLAYGRDQAQVIRSLCTNDFTSATGIPVDLKLVSGGTLLPSILADRGPDVYLGLAQADVINYAIRGALMNIEDMEGYDEIVENFNEAAMMVLEMDDSNGDTHCYGLPENQTFPMMFVRVDILADIGLEIPRTWEELYVAQSKLKSNNMEIGVPVNYQILLYQLGGDLFADNGMRINLDSVVGLESFETMCNMFTQYSFPYTYNAANRFRTGEMPIVISEYTALYNQLKVFATELDGSWTFVPLPGYEQEDGSINNCSVSTVTAAVMVKSKQVDVVRANYKSDAEYQQALKDVYGNAWAFTKWYTDYDCQVKYATEMVAIIGDSAKHSTANYKALAEMPWTEDERIEVIKQFQNLAAIPNYPGYYYIARYTDFAFLSAYNDDADPSTEILSYINTINKEITRKREEFNLETLEIGQTLAKKRSDQVNEALAILADKYGATTAGNKYQEAYSVAKYGVTNEKINLLQNASLLFAGLIDGSDGVATNLMQKKISGDAKEQKAATLSLREQTWFVYVSKQTSETKNGGYKISSLNEQQLVFFISECLCDIANALESYQ